MRCLVVLLFCLVFSVNQSAQRPPDIPLNADMNRQIVERAIKAINKYYVSEEVARSLDRGLRERLRSGRYDRITSAFDLIDALDEDMQAISKDAHLKLAYVHEPEPMPGEGNEYPIETEAEKEESRKGARARNYGFDKIERMAGNIGYIAMNSFVRPEFSGDTAGRAMSFLSGTDALIIDLRSSGGGSPDMVVFLASYFFDEEPFRLGEWYTRIENSTQQWWTFPYVPGGRYLNKPVFILVSRRSFSAVEGFAAVMQHHKKAVIVGEPTVGGTHPGNMIKVHPNFAVFVPMSWFIYPTGTPVYPIGRPIFPTTKTDFTGTSVQPDISAPAVEALNRAHLAALTKLIEQDPSRKQRLDPVIQRLSSPRP